MNPLFIQTGGTIDKAYPKTNLGYAFEIDEPAFDRILQKGHLSFVYDTLTVFKKDSTEITDEDRLMLKKVIQETSHAKIVVTHGSDTLIETAQFVGVIKNKTIVFTASYLPEVFKNSDADFNLGTAVGAISALNEGTFIAMNGQLFEPSNCQKNSESGKFEKTHE